MESMKEQEKNKTEEIAIKVENVSKTFRIPHEQVTSLRGAFVGAFNRNRTYEEFKALDNVSFEVKKGEFFGIIGRNGSGKSTLLKVLASIYQPDSGKVTVNGEISPFLELGIGFNPELSGRDNVYLNATVLGMTRKQINQKFNDIVAFAELERFIDQKLKNYSSGMQVRLAFAVSIHANRDILLMDEVLAVGDNNFQSKCLEKFAEYRDTGRTVIIVTHDISVVQRYCDRAILLRSGKIQMIGDPEKVGNEYIYQNMSDEEKRLVDEEKREAKKLEKQAKEQATEIAQNDEANKNKAESKKAKQKIAEITKVEFLDEKGNKKNVFETGDDINVRVYFKVSNKEEEFNFGVALFNEKNEYVMGINTVFDKVDVSECIKNGYIQVKYKNNPLNTGSYFIRTSVVRDNFVLPYDILMKSQYFKIMSYDRNEGIVKIEYEWN